MTANPTNSTDTESTDEQQSERGPTLGLAAVLARDDVTDPGDERVREAVEQSDEVGAFLARRTRAAKEGRAHLKLGDFVRTEGDGR